MVKIINANCLDGLKELPEKCVHTCVTSPPYFGLRDYGVEGQIGLEPTPQDFVTALVAVFREVKRVLRDDGTVWLNLGDSYAANRGYQVPDSKHIDVGNSRGMKAVDFGLKPKDLIGIPWRVAFALQQDGWYLRQDIIWHKPNPMPESVTDRCTKAHEYIFLLSKRPKYYFDHRAIKQPPAASTIGRGKVDFGGAKGRKYAEDIKPDDPNFRNGSEQWGRTFDCTKSCIDGVNRRDVWTVATKPCKEAHFATFPPDLIRPCILAGAPDGGLVLDPFMGAGTTAMVAKQEGRQYVGFELNPEYVEIAEKRIAAVDSRLNLPQEDLW